MTSIFSRRVANHLPRANLRYVCNSTSNKVYESAAVGSEGTQEYRLFFAQNNKPLSPWHDIPLYSQSSGGGSDDTIFNFVNEIPKGGRAKMEVATGEALNPIKQDIKKGDLRYYHFDSLVNYGCLPQTWEDPEHKDADTNYTGDNDPVDVVEVGQKVARCGEVYQVKVLGVLGMIDEGEMDWKVFALALDDPMAPHVHDMGDLERALPGMGDSVRRWFRDYKIPDGKPPSEFAFDGRIMPSDYALEVIRQTHGAWSALHQDSKEKGDRGHWLA